MRLEYALWEAGNTFIWGHSEQCMNLAVRGEGRRARGYVLFLIAVFTFVLTVDPPPLRVLQDLEMSDLVFHRKLIGREQASGKEGN